MLLSSSRIRGIGGVLVAAVLWGTTGTAATYAPGLSPLAVGAVAMGIGGLLQGAIATAAIVNQHILIIKNWRFLLTGAIAVAIYPLAFYASMHYVGVTVGTVISIGSAPILSALIESRLDGSRLTKQWICGAIIGVTGMVLLCLSESGGNSGVNTHATAGIFLGLLAGFTYAFYSWSARRLMQESVTSRAAMGVTFGAGAILLIPVLLVTGAPFFSAWNNAAVGIYMALIPMFLGYLCYGYGLARIPASVATTITLIEPVIAALLAIILVGEQLPPSGWVGVSLIIACLGGITVPTKKLRLNRFRQRNGNFETD